MCGIVKWTCDKNWGGKSGEVVDPKLKTSFFNDYSRHENVKCDQGIVFFCGIGFELWSQLLFRQGASPTTFFCGRLFLFKEHLIVIKTLHNVF